ncbi:MAG: hypothetical protein ACI4MP_04390 [Candidatus Ventricola sp.]
MVEAASIVSTASCWYHYSICARFSHAFSLRDPISGLESAPCKASVYRIAAAERNDEFCIRRFKNVHFDPLFLHFLRIDQKEISSSFPDLYIFTQKQDKIEWNACSLF